MPWCFLLCMGMYYEDYDQEIDADCKQDDFDPWEINDELFDNICEFYEKHPELNVKCYKKGEWCDSDEKKLW